MATDLINLIPMFLPSVDAVTSFSLFRAASAAHALLRVPVEINLGGFASLIYCVYATNVRTFAQNDSFSSSLDAYFKLPFFF